MILVFSIIMYPIFFIFSYAIGEYIYSTKNGAMLFAFLLAFVFSYLYYTIRTKVRQLTVRKNSKKQNEKSKLTSLLLCDERVFKAQFPKNVLADNSFIGVNEDKVIDFLRNNNNNIYDLHIYSVQGITEGAKDFLALINKKYTEHSKDEILSFTENIIPETEIKNISRFKKIKKIIFTKEFKIFAIKYGVILLILSLITPYKFYYIFFGVSLIIFGASQKFIKKISQQNQIPYPRS